MKTPLPKKRRWNSTCNTPRIRAHARNPRLPPAYRMQQTSLPTTRRHTNNGSTTAIQGRNPLRLNALRGRNAESRIEAHWARVHRPDATRVEVRLFGRNPVRTGPNAPAKDRYGRFGHRRNRLKRLDRKSTRLNSSHHSISYAVFC